MKNLKKGDKVYSNSDKWKINLRERYFVHETDDVRRKSKLHKAEKALRKTTKKYPKIKPN